MKKKGIIILVVVLVLAVLYYAWKRGTFAPLGLSGSSGAASTVPAIDESFILDSAAKPKEASKDKLTIEQLRGASANEVIKWGVNHPRLNPFLNPFMAPAFFSGFFRKKKK